MALLFTRWISVCEDEANQFPFLRPRAADAENQRYFTSWHGALGITGASAALRHPPAEKWCRRGLQPCRQPPGSPRSEHRAISLAGPRAFPWSLQCPSDFHLLLPPELTFLSLWLQCFAPSRKPLWFVCWRNMSKSPSCKYDCACAE